MGTHPSLSARRRRCLMGPLPRPLSRAVSQTQLSKGHSNAPEQESMQQVNRMSTAWRHAMSGCHGCTNSALYQHTATP
eukprot:625613-Amphidinium_carterae.2